MSFHNSLTRFTSYTNAFSFTIIQADPFFVIEFAAHTLYSSKVEMKTRNPAWNESCKILISHTERNYSVIIKVYDWDKASSNGTFLYSFYLFFLRFA